MLLSGGVNFKKIFDLNISLPLYSQIIYIYVKILLMLKKQLIEQFRNFYFKNYYDEMETLIEHFSVFGGLDIEVDATLSIKELIHTHIIKNFDILNEKILSLIGHDPINIRLLQALAVGDRRIFSAFKRAGLNNGNGGGALEFLQLQGLISMEYSREKHPKDLYPNSKLKRELARHRISHKVLFNHPIIRFWFYFISPFKQKIQKGELYDFFSFFDDKQSQYTSLVFEELSALLLNYNLRDAQILTSGSYWNMNIEIDILTITNKGDVYVGECKWTNHKVNKKELHKLNEKCEKLGLKPTQTIFFSKRGFSKELRSLEGASLALYSADDFKALLKSR